MATMRDRELTPPPARERPTATTSSRIALARLRAETAKRWFAVASITAFAVAFGFARHHAPGTQSSSGGGGGGSTASVTSEGDDGLGLQIDPGILGPGQGVPLTSTGPS
jgi:hypothetical protein